MSQTRLVHAKFNRINRVKDLVPYIGPLNRVYEVLAHKRPLSLNMIRRLSDGLNIPAEILIRESEAVEA